MNKKIVIIGGGVAGLSAGIYAQMNGFDTEIYEQHSILGGECTGWKRKGYLIDNCVHWLTGTNKQTEVYQTWCDLDVFNQDVEILQNESFLQIELNGETLNIWKDIDRIREDMLALSPQDSEAIELLIKQIKTYMLMDMPAHKPLDLMSIGEILRLLKKLKPIGKIHGKLSRVSLQDYAARFKHPLIQKFITAYMPEGFNISSWLFVLGTFCNGNGALPKGGSLAMINRMQAKYEKLGGKIFTSKQVTKLEYGKKCINGIHLKSGEYIEADYFITTCDLDIVYKKFLLPEHHDDFFVRRYAQKRDHAVYSSFNTYIDVDDECSFLPDTTWFNCEPYPIIGRTQSGLLLKSFNPTEPSYSPEGKNIFQILASQNEEDYNRWQDLYLNCREDYKAEKTKIAEYQIQRLETKYPELKGKMQVVETVSPYSYTRFCGAYKGSYMSFMLTPYAPKKIHKGHVRGLKNLFLSGQWLQAPGGLPNAAVTGKFAVQRLCKKLGIKFTVLKDN